MTDAPACGFDAVNVTVSKVRVHASSSASPSDPGWVDITLKPARKINLLDLSNGTLTDLGQTPLPAGHYTQLRLVLTPNVGGQPLANSVVPTGGVETALDTPSAIQSGIKLINQFDVAAGTLVDLTLDFNACKSIVTTGAGSYQLQPVIRVVPTVVSGSISGYVDPALAASHPVVRAEQNGTVIQTTVPDPTTGAFTLSPLVQSSSAGNYTVVVTADAHASAMINAVPVSAQTATAVSTSAAPLALPASGSTVVSGSVTLSPSSVGTPVYVDALQTLTSGLVVDVGSAAADMNSGAYSLSLPTAAPLLGQYGGSLPVALVAQSTVAGQDTVRASASGYTSQSVSLQLSGATLTQNFSLVP